jgi:hypothetical protein
LQKPIIRNALKWLGGIVLLATFFSCLWSLIWFYNLDAPSHENGSQKAQPLIDAIQAYHQRTGEFPTSLQALVPEYFPEIPKPDWRHQFEYGRSSNKNSFGVAFVPRGEAIGDGWYVYCSSRNEWQGTDSAGWDYVIYDC